MSIEDKLNTLNGYIEDFADDVADSANGLDRLSQEIESKTQMEPVCFTAKYPNLQLIFVVQNMNPTYNRYYFEYSVDKKTWTPFFVTQGYQSAVPFYTLENVGDKVYVRGKNDRLCSKNYVTYIGGLRIGAYTGYSGKILHSASVSGNLLSLLYGTEFCYDNSIPSAGLMSVFGWYSAQPFFDYDGAYIDVDTIGEYGLNGCFKEAHIDTPPIIKAKHIENAGCFQLFARNTILTKYELLLTNDLENCQGMFSQCTSLTDLTVHFTEFPSGGITNWMYSVAPTGTFRCPQELVISERNEHYVPAGWTIERI